MTLFTPVFVPAAFAGVALIVSWRLWRRRDSTSNGGWGGAIGFGLAYFTGYVLLAGWPEVPPVRAATWQACFALILAVLGLAQRWWNWSWFTGIPVRLVVSATFAALLLQNLLEYTWDRQQAFAWIGGLAVAITIIWESTERLNAQRPGASVPLAYWVLFALAAITFVTAGSALLGQLSGALAAACGAALVLAWWAPRLSLAGGAATVFVPMYAGMLMQAYFFGELPVWSAVVMAVAPLSLWLGEARRVRFTPAWSAALTRAFIVAVPMAVALGVAYVLVARQAPDDYYY